LIVTATLPFLHFFVVLAYLEGPAPDGVSPAVAGGTATTETVSATAMTRLHRTLQR
jgi:hypothetical protein